VAIKKQNIFLAKVGVNKYIKVLPTGDKEFENIPNVKLVKK